MNPAVTGVSWLHPPTFTFSGRVYRYFFHYHNCGWPPERCTERTVELALADYWLGQVHPKRLCEIGAVTPYYWPRRVPKVIDPTDPHRLVTIRRSLFAVSLRSRCILSISTLEHVGTGQYGLGVDPGSVLQAIDKIVTEAELFLLTVPVGCNRLLDDFLFDRARAGERFSLRFLVRQANPLFWQEEPEPARARLPYGTWANSVYSALNG